MTPGSSTTYTLTCTGSGGSAQAQTTVTVVQPPAAPASLTPTCSADGTHVTLSWPASSGATGYYPRIYADPKMSTSACTGFGWQEYGPDTRLCYPNPDNGFGGARTVSNFPVTPGKAYSAWVHAGGAGGIDWNQSANTSFTCAGSVNLTAGNTSSSAYNAGASQWFMPNTAEPFAGTVSNSGTAPASNFPNMFQYTNDYNTYYTASARNASLGANASAGVSGTITFPSAGTWHVRTCADYNTSYGTTITETNEGDNCGAWSDYIVTPPTPTNPTVSCNADGTLATLSWNASLGASFYYVRTQPSNGSCPVNWQLAPWDSTTCIPNPDNVSGTSVLFGTVPGRTYNWWVHGASPGGQWDNPATGPNFSCSGAADLTAGAVSPTTATAGQPVTLSGVVSNTGNSSTNSGFPNLLLIQSGPNGTGSLVSAQSISLGAIGSGGNSTVSGAYTFPSGGTYSAIVCADETAGWASTIPESNEGNNCGPWTNITVAAQVPTCTFSANPAVSIPSTLSWSSTNATSCTGAGGTFNTSGATSGSQSVNAAGTYQLSCTGAGGACSQSVNVASCTNPAVTLAASQTRVTPGSTVQITYSGSGVQGTCTLTGPGAPGTVTPAACALPSAQFTTPALTTQTMYTLTCGSATQSVTINVVPKFGEF